MGGGVGCYREQQSRGDPTAHGAPPRTKEGWEEGVSLGEMGAVGLG